MLGATIGPYRLLRSLGSGAHGEVFEGQHTRVPELRVAVKVLHPTLAADAGVVRALEAEVRLLARLQHPHILGVRDLVVGEGHPPAMVTDLLEGGSLERQVLSGPTRSGEVARLLGQALGALGFAHAAGVIHRDVKPANLLLDGRGELRLVDFGVAKAAESARITRSGMAPGTPGYMAPELFDGAPASAQSDLYALGLVGWELLVGRVACPAGTPLAAMRWHERTGPPPVDQVVGGVPAGLAALLARLTCRDPEGRPASAAAAAALLRDAMAAPAAPAPRWTDTVEVHTRGAVAAPAGGAVAPRWENTVEVPVSGGRGAVGRPPNLAGAAGLGAVRGDQGSPVRVSPGRPAPPPARPPAPPPPRAAVQPAPGTIRRIEGRGVAPFAFEVAYVPAGRFTMGSPPGEKGRFDNEVPHEVTLTRAFEVGVVPVTQALYAALMGTNPARFPGPQRPVERVSWFDAVRLCNAASAACGLPLAYAIGAGEEPDVRWDRASPGFRLPTEAEWEYAARAGGPFVYAGSDQPDDVAWTSRNSGGSPRGAGQKRPNGWGLHDMSGNVWEWCWDWYGDYGGASTDPVGAQSGPNRVYRGGSWNRDPRFARVAFRSRFNPGVRFDVFGLRLVRTIP